MSEIQDIEPESVIQRCAPYFATGVLVAAVFFYLYQFHGKLSTEHDTWGQFGDFVGGAVNPIIGLFTIWLLAASLRQNHKALGQANQALTQAKKELELTRVAIQQASDLQKATEEALQAQIAIASHARDMNNAVALHANHRVFTTELKELRIENRVLPSELENSMVEGIIRMHRLEQIMEKEEQRLVKIYGVELT